jgi:nicotinamide-nucleotide amidase
MLQDHAPSQRELEELAAELGKRLLAAGQTLSTAESCTGGWVAQCLTAIAGSSAWFDRGFVTYSNQAKMDMLGVPEAVLVTSGAVSENTAKAMAEGALRHSQADWALAITGIAGPLGGSPEKPVGMVCFGWSSRSDGLTRSSTRYFVGNREQVRAQAVSFALGSVMDCII